MSHHQSSIYSKSPTSQPQASPTREIVASSAQNPGLDEVINGPAYPKGVIEAVMSQPVVKNQMEGICRQLGRGEDISAALPERRKRGVKEVSGLHASPPSKKPRPKKPKLVNASQTVSDENKREQEKTQKEKPKTTCVACRRTAILASFPCVCHHHRVTTRAKCAECA
jgi:hypothetical protein